MLSFSESSEHVRKADAAVHSVLLRSGMLARMPNSAEYADDVARLEGGEVPADLAADLLALPEYDTRIP